MKKVIFALAASAMVLVTSCGGEKAPKGDFSPEETQLGDSLALTFGQYQGAQSLAQVNRMLPMMPEHKRTAFNKEEFLKGLELVMTTDSANIAFLFGLQQGLQMHGILDTDLGVPVDGKAIVASFSKVFNDTAMAQETLAKYEVEFQKISERVQDNMRKKEEAKALETEEAKENIAAGEKYMADRIAEGYSKSSTGLVYKIINPGDSAKVGENDVVRLSYVGKRLNGEEFDSSMGEAQRRSVANFIPGFREGLSLLGKGGQAIIVVPGDLGYGATGRGPIGKMEAMVFEITVEDVE